jgi:hypothetical protein
MKSLAKISGTPPIPFHGWFAFHDVLQSYNILTNEWDNLGRNPVVSLTKEACVTQVTLNVLF